MSMNRRSFLKLLGVSAGAATLSMPALLKAMAEDGTLTMIRGNVGFYTNRGGTIGVYLDSANSVMVDTQYGQTISALIDKLSEKNVDKLRAVINTHHHGDHTSGNTAAGKISEEIVAHENVPELMKQADSKATLPGRTYSDAMSLDLGKETVQLRYFGNAHTSGDSVVIFENANVVHMGDLMFNRVHPYIDQGAGASITNWREVLTQVVEMTSEDTQFIFGHGAPDFGVTGTQEDLIHMRSYFDAVIETVQKGIVSGATRDDVTAKGKVPGFEEHVSFGERLSPQFVLGVAYDELAP